jgi:hypothetical protein
MARRSRLFLASLALAAFVPAHAAELGDPRVVSHIGQPLVADVELTMLEDAATPVRVRVASPEVYDGAGIAMPPVLSSLNLSVMRRDGRQFLHVTSLRPVGADHVHLYLELVDKGDRAVRLATLWLTPDPNPAPAPAPARVAGPVVVPEPAAVPVLASKAGPVAVPEPAAVPVLAHKAGPVAVPGPAAVPVPARKAAVPAPAPLPVSDAVLLAQVERARAAAGAEAPPRPARIPARRPYPAPVARAPTLPVAHQDAHPQACAIPAGEAQACAALGAKNDELRSRLGQVEDRMKKLQVSLGVSGAAQPPAGPETKTAPAGAVPAAAAQAASAPAAAAPVAASSAASAPAKDDAVAAAHEQPKPIVPAGPRPIHSIKPLMPHKSKAPPPDEGLPWGWIGAAIGVLALALGGAGAFVVVRRRRAGGAAPAAAEAPGAAAPGVFDKLRARFAARTRAPQAEAPERRTNEPAEPTLE